MYLGEKGAISDDRSGRRLKDEAVRERSDGLGWEGWRNKASG